MRTTLTLLTLCTVLAWGPSALARQATSPTPTPLTPSQTPFAPLPSLVGPPPPPGTQPSRTTTPPAQAPAARPAVTPPSPPTLPATPPTTTTAPSPFLSGSQVLASLPSSLAPEMLGDRGPLTGLGRFEIRRPATTTQVVVPVFVPGRPTPIGVPQPGTFVNQIVNVVTPATVETRNVVVPRAREFKIAENESPFTQDRVYYSFNYFNQYAASANRGVGAAGAGGADLFQHHFGVEKSFLDNNASVGLRLPFSTYQADFAPGFGSNLTALGDLAAIFKYAVLQDREAGNVLSVGLAVAAPTGRNNLAGVTALTPHGTTLQPFVGFVRTEGAFYVQGFASVDVPAYTNDLTLFFADVAVGYWLYRAPDRGRWIAGIAPTVEAHLNTPLNHRGLPSPADPVAMPTFLNLTYGLNLELGNGARLGLGVVTPVTGPRAFNYEVQAQLRYRF